MSTDVPATALAIAQSVRSGARSALDVVEETLGAIARVDREINSFTAITAERARTEAQAIDAARAAGRALPPLAGVPYAVKNLLDVEGLTTLAGAKINVERPPAIADAALVARMRQAGAVLVGTLNMDEFAYGFTTENSHFGATRNPQDTTRVAGGSSGGSGAAVAARLVPLALASDTNGSIRVPASLCGVWGLKPTFGRLSRRGSFPFVANLDHLGPLAASLPDLAACYDVLQGADPADPACAQCPWEPVRHELQRDVSELRIARLGGYFDQYATAAARAAVERACAALAVDAEVELPGVALGRAAAFLITASEGGNLHLADLRERRADMEPLSRDRFVAGALLPASWYLQAQRVRAWYRERVLALFDEVDVLLAAATPCAATTIGSEWLELNGSRVPLRASMGLLTQPISCLGLPVVVAPITAAAAAASEATSNAAPHEAAGAAALPIGVQIIAAPWREDLCFRVAAALAAAGVATAPLPAVHA